MTLMQQEIEHFFSKIHTTFLDTHKGDIPEVVLERYPSKKRASEHYTSRLALLESLKSCKLDQFKSYSDLTIVNHHHMLLAEEALVSLSHTHHFAMASVTNCSDITSIGIDLENIEREIKPGLKKFYNNTHDQIQDQLRLWCIKEAAFKAISPLYEGEKQLVLKDIAILENGEFSLLLEKPISGYWKCSLKKEKLFTHAVILKSSQ
jgi:4'-phosphopantetheinyl transferase EntD